MTYSDVYCKQENTCKQNSRSHQKDQQPNKDGSTYIYQ